MTTFSGAPFAGNHTTVGDYLVQGVNLLVPDYQREFSWKEENVRQLMQDLDFGLDSLDRRKKMIQSESKMAQNS